MDTQVDDPASSTPAREGVRFKRIKVAAVSLLLLGGSAVGIVAASAPAQASQVNNLMYCEPDTGWCYQTNPPYNSAFPHECTWDYYLQGHGLESGMWYTGCDQWDHYIGTP